MNKTVYIEFVRSDMGGGPDTVKRISNAPIEPTDSWTYVRKFIEVGSEPRSFWAMWSDKFCGQKSNQYIPGQLFDARPSDVENWEVFEVIKVQSEER